VFFHWWFLPLAVTGVTWTAQLVRPLPVSGDYDPGPSLIALARLLAAAIITVIVWGICGGFALACLS
jgi:hypothetical protein